MRTGASDSGIFTTLPSGPNGSIFSSAVERWRPLVVKYFPASIVTQAMSVMSQESQGNPTAVNPIITQYGHAKGLFQHLEDLWASRSLQAGQAPKSIFDPEANVAVAAWLYGQTNNWNAWSSKPKVGL